MHKFQHTSEVGFLPVYIYCPLHTAVLAPVHLHCHLPAETAATCYTFPLCTAFWPFTLQQILRFPSTGIKMPKPTRTPRELDRIQHLLYDHKQLIQAVELKRHLITQRLELPFCNPAFIRIKPYQHRLGTNCPAIHQPRLLPAIPVCCLKVAYFQTKRHFLR